MSRFRCAPCMALLLGLSACGFPPVVTHLAPRLEVAESDVGAGTVVLLDVVDRRSDKSVGRRQHGLVPGSAIELGAPVEQTVAAALADALKRKDFQVVSAGPADATMTVEVRDLSYKVSGGAIGASMTTSAALSVAAESPEGTYTEIYSISDRDSAVVGSSEHYSDQRLSAALGEAMRRMVSDEKLLTALSAEK